MKYNDLVDIAEELEKNSLVNQYGLELVYKLPVDMHRRMNEELFFKTSAHKSGEELTYTEIIELTILNIHFKFIIE